MERKSGKINKNITWDRLDNTANLFPVIATQSMTNVYRLSVCLNEDIDGELLQKSVENVLPYFDVFNFRLKRGIFWYYFETNRRPLPLVKEESFYPCQYIEPYENNEYLFRVTYYKNRINLEVFHVLTDGSGGLSFLKEITYQYLRYKYKELLGKVNNTLDYRTSLDYTDEYVNNYKHKYKKTYQTKKAVTIRGVKLSANQMGLIHGYIPLDEIKLVARKYSVTLNQYLLAVYTWSIYTNYLRSMPCKKPISISVPVNLRPYFESDTMKNFFVIISSIFCADKDNYTFEEVLRIVTESVSEQITKDNLEKLFSYNVSNEKNLVLRAVPLFVKNIAMKYIYKKSAHANTTTITNLGLVKVDDAYKEYIRQFAVAIAMSEGQNMKGAVVSYDKTMVFTFTSNLKSTNIQRGFFRKLVEDGINVAIETNGVYYE